MEFSFLNITIQFEEERDDSISTSSSDYSGNFLPLVFHSDSSNDDSTDTEVSSSTSSYSILELMFGARHITLTLRMKILSNWKMPVRCHH